MSRVFSRSYSVLFLECDVSTLSDVSVEYTASFRRVTDCCKWMLKGYSTRNVLVIWKGLKL